MYLSWSFFCTFLLVDMQYFYVYKSTLYKWHLIYACRKKDPPLWFFLSLFSLFKGLNVSMTHLYSLSKPSDMIYKLWFRALRIKIWFDLICLNKSSSWMGLYIPRMRRKRAQPLALAPVCLHNQNSLSIFIFIFMCIVSLHVLLVNMEVKSGWSHANFANWAQPSNVQRPGNRPVLRCWKDQKQKRSLINQNKSRFTPGSLQVYSRFIPGSL